MSCNYTNVNGKQLPLLHEDEVTNQEISIQFQATYQLEKERDSEFHLYISNLLNRHKMIPWL